MRTPPPRLTHDMKKILQLSKNYRIGDWYFYQNHTILRIYGCEICPYRLPRYVPMRLSALEYFRQFINSDLSHFHSTKKKGQLKLRDQLGPFVMNKKEGWKDADELLGQTYRLKRRFWWVPYDPYGFINARRIKYRLASYEHCRIPDIEKYVNQDDWLEGTLVEELTEEDKMEQTMKYLEKTLDLESCGQVSFKKPQPTGESSSTATTAQQVAQERTTPTTWTTKGKELVVPKQEIMEEHPATSKEHS